MGRAEILGTRVLAGAMLCLVGWLPHSALQPAAMGPAEWQSAQICRILKEYATQRDPAVFIKAEVFRSAHLEVDCAAKVYSVTAEVTEYLAAMDSLTPDALDRTLDDYQRLVCLRADWRTILQMGWTITLDLRKDDAPIRPTVVVETCEAASSSPSSDEI